MKRILFSTFLVMTPIDSAESASLVNSLKNDVQGLAARTLSLNPTHTAAGCEYPAARIAWEITQARLKTKRSLKEMLGDHYRKELVRVIAEATGKPATRLRTDDNIVDALDECA